MTALPLAPLRLSTVLLESGWVEIEHEHAVVALDAGGRHDDRLAPGVAVGRRPGADDAWVGTLHPTFEVERELDLAIDRQLDHRVRPAVAVHHRDAVRGCQTVELVGLTEGHVVAGLVQRLEQDLEVERSAVRRSRDGRRG